MCVCVCVCVCEVSLSFPAVEDEGEEEEEERGRPRQTTTASDVSLPHMDSFDEVYKTYELTDFDRLLSRNIGRTE